ncbi:MAG: hypothetical protein U0900_17850 [Myxococcota bacterium]
MSSGGRGGSSSRGSRGWRGFFGGIAAGLVALSSGSASAFVYASGDLVGIFVDGGAELIVNLGPVSALSAGATFDFATPAGFGADGAIGGKFIAYATTAPFSGSLNRNVTYTAPGTVIPSAYDTNVTAYVSRLGLAQSVLDDGGTADKFLELLNNFPAPPAGGVVANSASLLSIPSSLGASYTSTIGQNGVTDRIDNQLPFETDVAITGTNYVGLWRGNRVTTTTASTQAIGIFEVTGNLGGPTPTARLRFLPEPAGAVALGCGVLALAGLNAAAGRRRRNPGDVGTSCRSHDRL